MEFSRQEYFNGLPCPSLRDPPNPGTEPASQHRRQILYSLGHQGSPGQPRVGVLCGVTSDQVFFRTERGEVRSSWNVGLSVIKQHELITLY